MLRLFVAVHPPAEYAAELLSRVADLDGCLDGGLDGGGERPKATPIAQVHCTLLFLGDRSQRELPATIRSCQAACAGVAPFRLRPVRLLALPARGPKRTVVFECDRSVGLLELHGRLVARLARETQRESKRAFLPHITVARWPGSGASACVDEPVSMPDFAVEEVRLMSSVLKPSGAEHRIVATVALRPS